MENIQVPFYALEGNQVAAQNDAALLRKLSEFCLAQLQRLKMVTSTFRHEFNLRASQRERSKGATKLARVLTRSIVKQAPYLANVLTEVPGGALVDSNGTSLVITACVYDHRSGQVINRYVRMLTYHLRKASVPVLVHVDPCTSGEPEEFTGIRTVRLRFDLSVWCPSPLSPISSQSALDSWLSEVKGALVASGKDPDGVYANSGLWRTYEPSAWHRESLMARTRGGGLPSLGVFERVFLHLPTAMHVIQTISRKFAYASNAFTIRAGESA